MLSTLLEMLLWGYVLKPAKNALNEGSTSQGVMSRFGHYQSWNLGVGD